MATDKSLRGVARVYATYCAVIAVAVRADILEVQGNPLIAVMTTALFATVLAYSSSYVFSRAANRYSSWRHSHWEGVEEHVPDDIK